jgi:hypothetical protein
MKKTPLRLLTTFPDAGSGPQSLPSYEGAGRREAEILRDRLAAALACPVALEPIPHLDPATWIGIALPVARHGVARAFVAGYGSGKRDGMDLHQGRRVDAPESVPSIGLEPLQ